jgi:hypothetical protein
LEEEEMKDNNMYEFISTSLKVFFIVVSVIVLCKIFYDYGKSEKIVEIKPEIKCIAGTTWELDSEKTFYVLQPDSKKCITVYEEAKQRVVK